MEEKYKGFFWPSYVDLLTSLFAVMLVLFVLSFLLFKNKEGQLQSQAAEYKVMKQEFEAINQLNSQIAALQNSGTFIYDSICERFVVKDFLGKEIFEPQNWVIKREYLQTAINAGIEIKNLIDSLQRKNPELSFIVIVEGNTALKYNGQPRGSINVNYEVSYKRALALVNTWKRNNINFTDTELIIAGSGIYGLCRDSVEENNKRFVVQIIPKTKKLG